ncbi:MAG: hypothetical protein H6711_24575 [Myxococcales bacterium]|nr:hypothetical protein [Myxococcales bacterium]
MNAGALAATLAGFTLAAVGVGALALTQGEPAAAAPGPDGWRPPCAQRLAREYREIDVSLEAASTEHPARRTVLFGVDRSPSNREVADAQLAAVVDHAKALPLDVEVGVLLISDRSDRSSTPDMPLEPARAIPEASAPPLPCAPNCQPRSLFEQHCYERLEEALEARADALRGEAAALADGARGERAARIDAWHGEALAYAPKPGTSLLAFFTKVADLPPVLRAPSRTTVVVLSDLEEARTGDRKKIDAFYKKYLAHGERCPEVAAIPQGLVGLDVVLLQTHTDGIDADGWGQRWEALLGCAGAHVRRQRYSPAVDLGDYLAPSLALAAAPAGAS